MINNNTVISNGGVNRIGFTITDGTVVWRVRHKDDKSPGEVYAYNGAMSEDGKHPLHKLLGIPILHHHICDGTNGTPNLSGRFIIGTGAAYPTGSTGGAATVAFTAAQMPVHTHIATAWTDVQGLHSHEAAQCITYNENGHYGAETQYQNDLDLIHKGITGWDGAHSHNIGVSIANTGGGQAHNNMPPYYALCYIVVL